MDESDRWQGGGGKGGQLSTGDDEIQAFMPPVNDEKNDSTVAIGRFIGRFESHKTVPQWPRSEQIGHEVETTMVVRSQYATRSERYSG